MSSLKRVLNTQPLYDYWEAEDPQGARSEVWVCYAECCSSGLSHGFLASQSSKTLNILESSSLSEAWLTPFIISNNCWGILVFAWKPVMKHASYSGVYIIISGQLIAEKSFLRWHNHLSLSALSPSPTYWP